MARVYDSFSYLWRLYCVFKERLKVPWNTSFDFEWFQSMARYRRWEIKSDLLSVLAINSYDITGKKQIVRLGTVASTINHSCDPNLIATHEGNVEINSLNFIAKTDIKRGDQLFISYVNPDLSKKVRFWYFELLILIGKTRGINNLWIYLCLL